MKSLFIFRRDFRLIDNNGLIEACKNSTKVLCAFIFTPEQVKNNDYFSDASFQFLLESLQDLNEDLQKRLGSNLYLIFDTNIKSLKQIKKDYDFKSVYFNEDYTPYARKRDEEIEEWCIKEEIKCHKIHDYLLAPIGTFLKKDDTYYGVYGPFRKITKGHKIDKPVNYKFDKKKFMKIKSPKKLEDMDSYYVKNKNLLIRGGRSRALKVLLDVGKFSTYDKTRDILDYNTTHLSAYIKYGTISIREVYHKFLEKYNEDFGIIKQLFWREFYFYIVYYNPKVLEEGKSLKEKYDKIKWKNNPKFIQAWKEGRTGYPAVDAAMRQLNTEGYQHNRGRLITSAILIKILHCDWRIGEKYFAQKLVDYDPAVNNGNWQWGSGSGADSQPYLRIFNPWTQSKKFDLNCLYIKKWIPELKSVPNKEIHEWDLHYHKYKKIDYPGPINDYKEARKETLEMYKKGIY
jgi:deoxyribodipyrimidine photo-lyase